MNGWIKLRTEYHRNGDVLVPYRIWACSRCHNKIEEAWPSAPYGDQLFCCDCGFILGYLSEKEYLSSRGFSHEQAHAEVIEGKAEVWIGRKSPFRKRTDREVRHTPEYNEWRRRVFERDDFTCRSCFVVGGYIEAHHIKSFKRHPSLRFVVDNGKTLCLPCHKTEHKKRHV